MTNNIPEDREALVDKLQLAVHPDQVEHTPVLLWGHIADFIIADRQALLSRIEAAGPKDKEVASKLEMTIMGKPERTKNNFVWIENETNAQWRTAIQKERERNV